MSGGSPRANRTYVTAMLCLRSELLSAEHARQRVDVAQHVVVLGHVVLSHHVGRLAPRQPDIRDGHVMLEIGTPQRGTCAATRRCRAACSGPRTRRTLPPCRAARPAPTGHT